jgi:signal transduction histidine kinase
LFREFELVSSNKLAVSLLNAVPLATMLLNQERQLIFGNHALLELMEVDDVKKLIGLKPGEILGCNNVKFGTDGCGTSHSCKVCGSFKALNDCINTGYGSAECTLNTSYGSLNLSVQSEIIVITDQEFILFSLRDISDEKKRLLLERIFYHDILNTAHNVSGMTELLISGEFDDSKEQFLGMLMKSATKLIDEINTHRLITHENHFEQIGKPVLINSIELFNEMATEFNSFMIGDSAFILDGRSENFSFYANRVLIKRVVTNMIKNAFEAEGEFGKITFGIIPLQKKGAMIWVNNPSYMDEEIQLQIFNRSFSTKSSDRGLGTYSMKMLTEKYLKGKIYFTSKKETGTSFIIEVPGQ